MMASLKKLEISEAQKKIALIILGAVIFLYLDLAFILSGQFRALKEGAIKLRQLKSALRQFESDRANLPKLKSDIESLEEKREKLEKQVTPELELANLLDEISREASDNGVKIMQIKPASLDTEKEKSKATIREFYPLLIAMELRSSYHNLGEFLSSLESNPFIGVNSLKINYNSDSPAYHQISLSVKVYVEK